MDAGLVKGEGFAVDARPNQILDSIKPVSYRSGVLDGPAQECEAVRLKFVWPFGGGCVRSAMCVSIERKGARRISGSTRP